MSNQRALLSAPGAHRWLICPPSATLEAGLPDSSSSAAEQGTAARELAEWKLRRALSDAPTTRPVSDWHDAEMKALADDYVTFVQERLRDVRQVCPDPQALIEQRLDFSHVVPKSNQGGKPKHSESLIIPKDDTEILTKIERANDAAIGAGMGKFGGKRPNKAPSISRSAMATSNVTTKPMQVRGFLLRGTGRHPRTRRH